jgi:hypothetical protein
LGSYAPWVPPSSSAVDRCASVWSYCLEHASGEVNYYYPARGGTRHVQAPRKASAEVSNLSNGEICSNYSLSFCPRFLQPFTTLPEGQVLKALRSRISSSGMSRGPTIDVFNFGGGRYRTLLPAPPGAPPSTSSTSVVGAVGPYRQHPQGPRHRRLQLWWWALPDLAASTPRGPHPRRLQLRWWPLPDLAASTP